MSFDQSTIAASASRSGDSLKVAWSSTAPAGSVFQVYIDRKLAYHGTGTACYLAWPPGPIQVDVGVVDPADAATDFSGSLASGHAGRATLAWQGGTYLSPTIGRFLIYSGTAPGGPVSYASPAGSVPAYDGGLLTDGYGMGGYGAGGYGFAASDYSWTSPSPLAPGVWSFAVVPVDEAGNAAGTPTTTAVTIDGPPRPPAANAAGKRLTYAYNAATKVATLNWLASPT